MSVSVPATSANLGPGFDCLGLALELRNHVSVEEIESGLEVHVSGEGAASIPRNGTNLAVRAMDSLFRQVGRRPAGLRVNMDNKIPVSSGPPMPSSRLI
jgi:homoserine kinase